MDYFSSHALRKNLKAKTVRGGLYMASANAATALLSLAMVVILSRLLQKADFGLVAMVTVFTGLAAMFVDAGLSMATIQRDEINHDQVSNLFWIASGLGIGIALVVSLLSPLIAWFYDEPRLIPITLGLSASFVFAGLTIQHQALLRRAMRFKAMAGIKVLSYALSCFVAVAIALVYRSYWALVFQPISVALFRMAASWFACRWRPGKPKRGVGTRSMLNFGASLTGFSFINYFARSGDNMLLGWWWGEVPLALYERGYKLIMAPLVQFNAPLASLVVPAMSRLCGEPAKYRQAYFQALRLLQVMSCPLMAFIAVTAPRLVNIVFGPGWEDVGPVLRWLAIAAFMQPLSNSLGWLYISQGRGRDMMQWGFVGCPIIILSFVAGLPWGPVGVACSYALVIWFVIVPLSYWFAGRKGPVSTMDLVKLSAAALTYAMPTTLVSIAVMYQARQLSDVAVVAISGAGSMIISCVVLLSSREGRRLALDGVDLIRSAFYGQTVRHT